MTETTERTAGTALEQVAPGSLAFTTATDPTQKFSFTKIIGLLAGPAEEPAQAPVPDPMQPTRITEELTAALKRLPEVFGSVVPTEARRLEAAELKRLTDEQSVISAVITELGKRNKHIDEAVRNHMDTYAPDGAPVIGSGVAKGHRLIAAEGEAFKVPVEGYADSWEQRMVGGKAEASVALLSAMVLTGQITQADFNAMTAPVRVIDEAKVERAVKKDPKRFLSILKAATVRKGDTAQLVSPKK